jgi:hypothetical protein
MGGLNRCFKLTFADNFNTKSGTQLPPAHIFYSPESTVVEYISLQRRLTAILLALTALHYGWRVWLEHYPG